MTDKSSEGKMTLDYIDPGQLEFFLDRFTGLNYRNKNTNETYEDIRIRRMFPLSQRDKFLLLSNEEGELGIIYSIDELEPDYRQLLYKVLDDQYFVPEIKSVEKVEEKYRLIHWQVVTDRGPMEFYTRTRNDIVVKGTRVYIRDIDSNRYLIRDHTALSPKSQRELSSEI